MARVFVSCGQDTDSERAAAESIRSGLVASGFEVYVAIAAQSIEDVNSGIIRNLKLADYYVFVDFARDRVNGEYRGSLFTNQELAIAYVLGFERVLFFQQRGMKREGLLRYMGSNAIPFDDPAEVPSLLESAFLARGWPATYSRHLRATRPRFPQDVICFGEITGRFLYVDIENRRTDVAAFESVARLITIVFPDGTRRPTEIRSPLKVTGAPGFAQTIWPQDYAALDLLAVSAQDPRRVYLNCALDVTPLPFLFSGIGAHVLKYAVLARDFPILRFEIELTLTGILETTSAQLLGVDDAG